MSLGLEILFSAKEPFYYRVVAHTFHSREINVAIKMFSGAGHFKCDLGGCRPLVGECGCRLGRLRL